MELEIVFFFEILVQIETNTNRHVENIEASLGKAMDMMQIIVINPNVSNIQIIPFSMLLVEITHMENYWKTMKKILRIMCLYPLHGMDMEIPTIKRILNHIII